MSDSGAAWTPKQTNETSAAGRIRRSYKACANCRKRKAKCDLGDLDAPRDPPCIRCRREGIECTFLPSRRGGHKPFNAGKQKRDPNMPTPPGSSRFYAPKVERNVASARELSIDELDSEPGEHVIDSAMGHISSLASNSDNRILDNHLSPPFDLHELGRAANSRATGTVPNLPPPFSKEDIFHHTRNAGTSTVSSKHSQDSPYKEIGSSLRSPPAKRQRTGGLDHSSELTTADLRNPGDALELLSRAATGVEKGNYNSNSGDTPELVQVQPHSEEENKCDELSTPSQTLEDFVLVKSGIISGKKLCDLISDFFSRCHFIYPMCPHTRVPRTEAAVARFASEEVHLTTVFCVIASRHDRNPRVHDKCWAYFQTLLHAINTGKVADVGAVEALLLLSEFLPRLSATSPPAQLNAEENRLSWMLVGSAVRLACVLGLDQLDQSIDIGDGEGTPEQEASLRLRLAWTYCYMFDRQISIRTGNTSFLRDHAHSAATRKFWAMRFIPDVQDDFSSLIQSYLELTQILSSCHNVFHPSKTRASPVLEQPGVYLRFLEEFSRSLEGFKRIWEAKRWATFPLTECVWITFHYVRLYVSGFALQAHLQRVTRAKIEPEGFFPEGVMGSPGAEYILDAIDAAADLLRLVTDRLYPGGALPYLPRRFFMFFAYAGVFLLRAVHMEAVTQDAQSVIIRLLRRFIFVLACSSTDDQHPGVRFARLLNSLMQAFNDGDSTTNTAAPTRRNSPQPLLEGLFNPTEAINLQSDLPHSTPFPMLPFEATQSLQQLGTVLDGNLAGQAFDLGDLDLGLVDTSWYLPTTSSDNFNDPTSEFWQLFDSTASDAGWLLSHPGGLA